MGNIIESYKLSIDDTSVKSLEEENQPRNQRELSSFLVLCNVYRRSVRGYTNICAPLNALLKMDAPKEIVELTGEQEIKFLTIIEAVKTLPI